MREPLVPAPTLAPASALVWWLIGYMAWLVDGLGGDIEGGDAYAIASDAVTIPLLLPDLAQLVLGAFVGGVCAGLLAMIADGGRLTSLAASFAGVTCAVLLTGIQSTFALNNADAPGYDGGDSFGQALIVVTAAASLLGWSLGVGGSFGRVPLGIALAGLAGALPMWLGSLVFAIGLDVNSELLRYVIQYAGAGLLALGLVTIGISSYRRLFAWPVAIALAWIALPAYSVAGLLGATARWPGQMWEMAGRTWDVVKTSIPPENHPADTWLPFAMAILLAMTISVRLAMRRAAADESEADRSPVEQSSTTTRSPRL